MKIGRMICMVVLVALCAVGWIAQLTGAASSAGQVKKDVTAAREYEEKGLYQKAMQSYAEALGLKESSAVRTEYVDVSGKAYDQGVITKSAYREVLEQAIAVYPKNTQFWEKTMELLWNVGDYNSARKISEKALQSGVKSDLLEEYRIKTLYACRPKGRLLHEICLAPNGYAAVKANDKWGVYQPDGEELYDTEYLYISPYNSDNVALYCTEDYSAIIDKDGTIQAYLSQSISQARAYGDGILPVASQGAWHYIDCDRDHYVLGHFESASSFQDGYAVVLQNGTWSMLGLDGTARSDVSFRDVKLYENGTYAWDGVMVADDGSGYGIFQTDGKRANSFAAKDMDVYMGGYLAFQDASGKWGFVDRKGKVVIEPQFQQAKSFSNGLAAAYDGSAWGFVDTKGQWVIPAQYLADAGYFSEKGVCYVSEVDGQYYAIVRRFF